DEYREVNGHAISIRIDNSEEGPMTARPVAPRPAAERPAGRTLISRRSVAKAGILTPLAALLGGCGSGAKAPEGTLRVLDAYANEPDHTFIGEALEAAAEKAGGELRRGAVDGSGVVKRGLVQGSSGRSAAA